MVRQHIDQGRSKTPNPERSKEITFPVEQFNRQNTISTKAFEVRKINGEMTPEEFNAYEKRKEEHQRQEIELYKSFRNESLMNKDVSPIRNRGN